MPITTNNEYLVTCIKRFCNILVPLKNYEKYNTDGWKNKVFTPKDFFEPDVTGIAYITSRAKDFVTIDIDCKNLTETEREAIERYINHLIGQNINGICIDKTVNGGYHIMFKATKEDREKIKNKKYLLSKSKITYGVEYYTDDITRLVVLYPSKVKDENGEIKQYERLYGSFDSIDYIPYDVFESIVLTLRDIVKTRRVIDPGTGIKLYVVWDENSNKWKVEYPYDKSLRSKLHYLNNVILKNPDYLKIVLQLCNIDYKEENGKLRIPSIVNANYNATVYTNNAVYQDPLQFRSPVSYVLYAINPKVMQNLLDVNHVDTSSLKNIDKFMLIDDININISVGKNLLIAQTGSGKTCFIKEQAKRHKIVLAVPYAVQVAQEEEAYRRVVSRLHSCGVNVGLEFKLKRLGLYKMAFLWAGAEYTDYNGANLIITTYEQLPKVSHLIESGEYILVVDEAHELILSADYRGVIDFIWKLLRKLDRYTLMTATNYFLYLEDFVDNVYKLRVHPKKNRYFTFVSSDTILSNILHIYKNYKDVVQLVYIDNKDKLMEFKQILVKNGINESDIVIVTADNKCGAESIIRHSVTSHKVYLTTRVLSAGFHIFEEKTFVYHILPSEPNIMIQELNRVRERKGNIELNNTVYALVYVPKKAKNMKVTTIEEKWRRDYQMLKHFIEVAKRLMNKYLNVNEKVRTLDINTKWYKMVFNDVYAVKYLHDRYNSIIIQNKPILRQILLNEGFTEQLCPYLPDNKVTADINTNVEVEKPDYYAIYLDVLPHASKHASLPEHHAEVVKYELKLTPTEKKIYRLVKRILQYRHAFTDDDIAKFEQWFKQGKIAVIAREVTNKLVSWAILNLDKLNGKDRAIIEAKLWDLIVGLQQILQKGLNKEQMLELKTKYKVSPKIWNSLLQFIGIKYHNGKRTYVVVDQDKFNRFLSLNLNLNLNPDNTTVTETETETQTKVEREVEIEKTTKEQKIVYVDIKNVDLASIYYNSISIGSPLRKANQCIVNLKRKYGKNVTVILRVLDMRWLAWWFKYNPSRWDKLTMYADKVQILPLINDDIFDTARHYGLTIEEAELLYWQYMNIPKNNNKIEIETINEVNSTSFEEVQILTTTVTVTETGT